jgi:hypothetical protein
MSFDESPLKPVGFLEAPVKVFFVAYMVIRRPNENVQRKSGKNRKKLRW